MPHLNGRIDNEELKTSHYFWNGHVIDFAIVLRRQGARSAVLLAGS